MEAISETKGVFCYGEPGRFPVSQFGIEVGQLVHMNGRPHYLDGSPAGETIGPGLDIDPDAAVLAAEIYTLALKRNADDLKLVRKQLMQS
jgi:hypothetical protein